MAKKMKANNERHNTLGLSVAEAAFYDAGVQNDAAILQMGDEKLKQISIDLVWAVQQSATIDWSLKESVRAAMRSKVRRQLTKHGYPPDLEDRAIELLLQAS
jgi:type I restriction enzyme R subunit